VFLITHDLDTLYAICDRVAVLADRKVVAARPLAEVERSTTRGCRNTSTARARAPRAMAAASRPEETAV
jgi:ABC-type transporter Mla maintaining outer membrane lipid asymmetry ATPase subunit MlaF